MLYNLTQANATEITSDCVIIGIYENNQLTHSAQQVDEKTQGFITGLLNQGDISGKLGQVLILHNLPVIAAKRLLLIGCGKLGTLTAKQYSQLVNQAFTTLQTTGVRDVSCYLTEIAVEQRDEYWQTRQIVEQANYTQYRFNQFKKQPAPTSKLQKITIYAKRGLEKALSDADAISKGINLTRDLGNLPPNICTPAYLAEQALQLAKTYSAIKAEILDVAAMEKLGMGALLAVAQGSNNPAKFIILQYMGNTSEQAPIVLVGKGVTFDTGGICIKPRENMDEMKFDMCGAASVFGTLCSLAELKLPLNVIGLIPAVENMPDGLAYRPGDIVKSLSGQTIEIMNTDAEGRLILCDALTYAERFKPAAVIDIATLTGAIIIALGFHTTGLFSNDDQLAAELLSAAKHSNDSAWQLPHGAQYQEALNSNFADMVNSAGRDAGSITAACFLARYTENYPWAHLDIAGTAWKTGKEKGATGRPVALLVQFLLNRVKQGQ